MGTKRQLRDNAHVLLAAVKDALSFCYGLGVQELESDEKEREKIMAVLRTAIDTADPPVFDPRTTSVKLVMTPISWRVLRGLLESHARTNADDKVVLDAVLEGLKESKQRVYVTLSINPLVLRRVKWVLDHQAPAAQDDAFKRMAKQIEEEGLSKNPMEILAKQGL